MSPSRRPRRFRERHKHLTYFKLEKALATPGCPICSLVRASLAGFFESFLYEKVNDVGLRARFNADSGICNRHAHELLAHHDGLAIALLYRPILERAVGALSGQGEVPTNGGSCLFCESEREAEDRYLSVLTEYLDDEELERAFAPGRELCLPHYELARLRAASIPSWFAAFHSGRYADLTERVKRYLDAANWSLGDARPTLSPEAERVWIEVIERCAGYEGMQARKRGR